MWLRSKVVSLVLRQQLKSMDSESSMVSKDDAVAVPAKQRLMGRAIEFLIALGDRAIISCHSDSTPALLQATHVAKLSRGQPFVRKAGRSADLLLQRIFLKSSEDAGQQKVTRFFPRPWCTRSWEGRMGVLHRSLWLFSFHQTDPLPWYLVISLMRRQGAGQWLGP